MVLRSLYASGLRISEAWPLTAPHIDSRRMVVRVLGKGQKERLVPLSLNSWKNCVPTGVKRGRRNGCSRARIPTNL